MVAGRGIEPRSSAYETDIVNQTTCLQLIGGASWDRTRRGRAGGFTVHCITVDASAPLNCKHSPAMPLHGFVAHVESVY